MAVVASPDGMGAFDGTYANETRNWAAAYSLLQHVFRAVEHVRIATAIPIALQHALKDA